MYNIGCLIFRTKKECAQFTREIINEVGISAITKDNNYYTFFNNLLKNHDECEEKIGCGIDYFYIERNKLNRSVFETYIKRLDGSNVNFSWIHCCNFKPKSNKQNILNAMRSSIADQIIEFRNNNEMCCVQCECIDGSFHIDHVLSFHILSNNFLDNIKIKFPTNFDKCEKTNLTIFKKDDEKFMKEWQDYHRDNSVLQVLCKSCNLKKSKY